LLISLVSGGSLGVIVPIKAYSSSSWLLLGLSPEPLASFAQNPRFQSSSFLFVTEISICVHLSPGGASEIDDGLSLPLPLSALEIGASSKDFWGWTRGLILSEILAFPG
jgi:hypothetical protein